MKSRVIFCDKEFAIINKVSGEVCSFEENTNSVGNQKNKSISNLYNLTDFELFYASFYRKKQNK